MKFTPIHVNTEYSFQESTIRIDALIEKAIDLGLESLVITDHNSMFGVAEFIHKTKINGIKPIVGLDLDVENYRLILLAKNFDGYKILNKLSSRKMRNEEIKVEDVISKDIYIIDHPTKGHFATKNSQLIAENYFVGSETETFENAVYVQEGRILKEDERETLKLLSDIAQKEFNPMEIEPLEFEIDENNIAAKQATNILKDCNIEWPLSNNHVPKFKNNLNLSSIEYMKKIIQENAKVILKNIENIDQYKERIRYEVNIIEKLGFEDYFLIIWDLIKWSKDNGISIGPGRGSAAGSIISYLLNITEVDPIEYGLLFERFLNPERVTMPDIDIDIQDNRRDEVIKYLFTKYNLEKVALISTFSRLGAKSAIRDVARFLNIPARDVNTISKLISSDMKLNESYKKISKFRAIIDSSEEYTKLFRLSITIEGLPRQYSTHAAGIVLSDELIINKAPTIIGADGYNQVQYSMDYLEENGLLKIDLLGLRNLTIIKKIQEEIFKNHGKRVELKKIPLNDKLTNEILSQGDTNGIFQLESYGMKKTLQQVGVSSLDDIVAILSLYRPGPMEHISLYADIKQGKKKMESISVEYDEITKPTYGIIVYQEQIMQIAQRYSGMSFGQADILRRAIGKKNHTLINSFKKIFINGAIESGKNITAAEKIYDLIEKFANYGFNKSHAVAYSILSYRMAYLKVRFKFEFYTALLDMSISSQSTVQKYVEEAKRRKIQVIAPDINKSMNRVVNLNSKIILPLQTIKGCGDSVSKKIISIRKIGNFKDLFDFVARVRVGGIGESGIELLIESGSLRQFGNTQSLLDSLPSALRYAKMITYMENGIEKIDKTIISKPKMVVQPRNISLEIFNEKKLLGFQMNAFVTQEYETDKKILNIGVGQVEDVVVLVERIKKYTAKNGDPFGRITISDSSSVIEMTVFGSTFRIIEKTKERIIVKAHIECKIKNGRRDYILKTPWKEVNNG